MIQYKLLLKCRKVHQASWHHIPEDNEALVKECEKLKSHILLFWTQFLTPVIWSFPQFGRNDTLNDCFYSWYILSKGQEDKHVLGGGVIIFKDVLLDLFQALLQYLRRESKYTTKCFRFADIWTQLQDIFFLSPSPHNFRSFPNNLLRRNAVCKLAHTRNT
jgi:hypothetical protein